MSQSKTIMTTLRSGNKKLSGDKVKTGPCVFPFNYKGKEYNECFPGKYGDWCATEVDEKGKMKKYAFCKDESKPTKKVSSNKANSPSTKKSKKKAPPKKPSSPKPKSKKVSPPKAKANTTAAAPKPKAPSAKKTYKFKRRDPLQGIDEKYLIKPEAGIVPSVWELPNRKTFPNWMYVNYKPYLAVKNSLKTAGKSEQFSFFKHQKLVRDYIQSSSPYRGLLLYHGLGVGKTCASIGIAEGFRSDRKIVILLNKSLKKNFRVNLMKCGFEYFRTNQHWIFVPLTGKDNLYVYAKYLGITRQFLDKHGGCMIIDFSKKPNYEKLSDSDRELLQTQIDHMIDQKYEFIHLDGLNKRKLEKMLTDKVLDNKLLIIDEVHNLTNAMAKDHPGFRAQYLKRLIMDAENLKCVFLSGTPMINKLFEAGQLFNLLRGFIHQFVIKLTPTGKDSRKIASLEQIKSEIMSSGLVDQIMLDKSNKVVSFTRVPFGFRNLGDEGIINDPANDLSNGAFTHLLEQKLGEMGYKASTTLEKHTAFPEDENKFMSLFFDSARNKIKNPRLFQSRILGLVSYFKTNDKSLIPEVTKNEVQTIDMSKYQFLNYSEIRKAEIEQDKRKKQKTSKKKEDEKEGEKSSYRAYSRMHCSFVFPESIPRPYPSDQLTGDDLEAFEETRGNPDEDNDFEDPTMDFNKERKAMLKQYEKAKDTTLRKLNRQRDLYLKVNKPDGLPKYSPKYNMIINEILKSVGNVFVYTEYRSLEGISVFQICLNANGYAPFLIRKTDDGDYEQYFENEEDREKPKYAVWGGDPEVSDIIRKVYNNEFFLLPPKLAAQIKASTKTNLRGETIKVLLTTKTGAEGIDLKNVRQVHIIEPFWNPVRINQVKGRAVRVASHIELPPAERKVEITTYLSTIKKEDLKSDRIINDDSDGKSSDEVLFGISHRKLQLMEDLLNLVNGSSIDCAINREETYSQDNKFDCVSYGAVSGRDYVSVPDIDKEVVDSEKIRVVKQKSWKPVFIKIPIGGSKKEFAMRKSESPAKPSLLYSAKDMRAGIVTDALGEYQVGDDGKTKIKFYKKGGAILPKKE
jgi:hypothetical protein